MKRIKTTSKRNISTTDDHATFAEVTIRSIIPLLWRITGFVTDSLLKWHQDIAEILLKLTLNTNQSCYNVSWCWFEILSFYILFLQGLSFQIEELSAVTWPRVIISKLNNTGFYLVSCNATMRLLFF
jgi:hypothetical protein